MNRLLKKGILRAVRAAGYDIFSRSETPYAIFPTDRAVIADVTHDGCALKFMVGNPDDIIQRIHLEGALYEPEELALIAHHYVPESVFVDIGANVGNHVVWAAKCLGAPRVISFEPTLGQHTLLCANVALNDLSDVVTVRKVALSSAKGKIRISGSLTVSDNSGASRVTAEGLGEEVPMSTGDLELADVGPVFIKIDVEGHEIAVLEGLRHTIQKYRPLLFVEVDNFNSAAFSDWMNKVGYEARDSFSRYEQNCNYLIAPKA